MVGPARGLLAQLDLHDALALADPVALAHVDGLDDAGRLRVYVSDPGNGKLKYWDWNTFEWMWDVMDGMALSLWR